MKSFSFPSLRLIFLLSLLAHGSGLLFSMEKEPNSKQVLETASCACNKIGQHRRERSLSAFSNLRGSDEANTFDGDISAGLSISPPIVLPSRSNSSPERNKKITSYSVHRKRSEAFSSPITPAEAKESNLTKQLEQLRTTKSDNKTKIVDRIIANFGKPAALAKMLTKAKILLAINHRSSQGMPPLHHAIFTSQVQVCAVLLKAGAEINSQDKSGNTALHRLFNIYNEGEEWWKMHSKFLEYKEKLKPDLPNYEGQTPLYVALNSGIDAVSFLVNLGADVNVPVCSNGNLTALDLLNTSEPTDQTDEIKNFLIKKGAKNKTKYVTRKRTTSHEAVTLLRNRASEYLPKELSDALQTLLAEHDNTQADDQLGLFKDLPSSKNKMLRREISTADFNKKKLREFHNQHTKEKDGKPYETFHAMPEPCNPQPNHLITREGSPLGLGPRKNRVETVYSPLPLSEEESSEAEDDNNELKPIVITVNIVDSPKAAGK